MNWFKNYIQKKWEWVDKHPRAAAWLGWFKGFVAGFLIWYIFF